MLQRRLAPLSVVLAVLAAMAGCTASGDAGSDGGGSAPTSVESTPREGADDQPSDEPSAAVEVETEDELYAVPEPIPSGEHGDLLKYQEVDDVPGDDARAYRVMYLSESIQGDPVVVTGTVVVPVAQADPGGRTVLGVAHGTTGIADQCAPSLSGGAAELVVAVPAVERGWIVAITDYEGLGTPGRHPYLVGVSEGRAVLDSARAAAQLPEADASDTLLLAGYSQGGHGSLWANEIAAEWTPELDVAATFAGAPATELDVILAAAPHLPVAGFAYMIIAGFGAAYPEADPASILTPEGADRLAAVDEGCTGEVFAAVSGIPASDLIRPEGPGSDPWKRLAEENNPGQRVTEAPILIIHSDQDDTVPPALSDMLFQRICGLGQAAERRVLEHGGGHITATVPAYTQAIEWFDTILVGDPVPDGCP